MYKRAKLNNGLRIITRRLERVRSVALGIWINIGSRHEPQDQKGISHVLEHLLFKGSKKYSCRQIKESIEGIGGTLNGFTSEEHTCYLVKVPQAFLAKGLDILSDMVINPLLKSADLEKEKTVILEELKMYRDLPQSYVNELLDELLWPNQPLGSPIIGTVQTVSRITRQDLQAFQACHYTPANIVISAAGSMEHEFLTAKIRQLFVAAPGSVNTFLPVREAQGAPQLKIFHKATEQTHMALGFHALKRDHHLRHAQTLLHIILGANMSSRLFNEVREKRGLAYEIGTGIKRYHDTGVFLIHAGIDNRKVGDCLQLIFKELAKTRKSLISKGEFKRAKDFYLGQLSLALEDTLEYMLWMGESMACLDKVYSLEEVIKELKRVSCQDCQEVARRIFREEAVNLALIGPLEKQEKEIYRKLSLK